LGWLGKREPHLGNFLGNFVGSRKGKGSLGQELGIIPGKAGLTRKEVKREGIFQEKRGLL